MKSKKICSVLLAAVGFSGIASANEVSLNAATKMEVAYRVAHKNVGGNVVLGGVQTIQVNGQAIIPVELEGYDLAGVVPVSIDGHNIPSWHTQFDKLSQCSMATDQNHPSGNLVFAVEDKELKCAASGGVVR